MGFLKRLFKNNPTNDFTINETATQSKYPKNQKKVIPLSDNDFEYMKWRRKRMAR